MTYVGQSLPRVEDGPLLTGDGRFLDDLRRGGQLTARIVRSEVAHGQIVAVHAEAARRRPDVAAVITAADIPDIRIPVRMMPSDEAVPVTQPPLARERVRYVGEPVAVVLAGDAYTAEDAADDVRVEIEPLEPLVDGPGAASPGAPVLHGGALTGNVVNRLFSRWGRDVDELIAAADVVVRDRLAIQRHAAIPLETRGLLAEFDERSGSLTVWGPTKVKHFNRALLAGFLELPEESVRFVEPDVGGGFGARGEFYPEDFLVPWLARALRRPVKWVEDRREHFTAINHSRETSCEFELGASADGRLLAFRASCLVDQGAYARTHGTLLLPWVLVHHLAGPYVWEGLEIEARSVLTNKTPSGTYRGPAQFEAAFFRERMLDRLAAALELDPAELRSRNLIPVESMPYRMELSDVKPPVIYDNGDFPQVMSSLLERSSYKRLRDELARRRARGELVGVGVAAYVEETGLRPARVRLDRAARGRRLDGPRGHSVARPGRAHRALADRGRPARGSDRGGRDQPPRHCARARRGSAPTRAAARSWGAARWWERWPTSSARRSGPPPSGSRSRRATSRWGRARWSIRAAAPRAASRSRSWAAPASTASTSRFPSSTWAPAWRRSRWTARPERWRCSGWWSRTTSGRR